MIEAKRIPGWRARMAVALAQNEAAPFAWGSNDCFLGLLVPTVQSLIGVDIGAEYRGTYDSEASAIEVVANSGFADLTAFIAYNFPEIPPALAHVGDIAVIVQDGDPFGGVLGIVIGERIVSMGDKGRATVKMLRANRAFRVG